MRIITSGLKRCEETLEIIYGDVPHVKDSAFREMHFGSFEMRSYEEMKNDPEYISWISGDNEPNLPESGSSRLFRRGRMSPAVCYCITSIVETAYLPSVSISATFSSMVSSCSVVTVRTRETSFSYSTETSFARPVNPKGS